MLQLELPVVHRVVDDVEMGILEDGTPYLSMRALAGVCGVVPSVISQWLTDLPTRSVLTPRDRFLVEYLRAQNHDPMAIYRQIEVKGVKTYAVPDTVCMGVIEYYAFEVSPGRPGALDAYRRLARVSMRAYIYKSLGYELDGTTPEWQQFHDRLLLVRPPEGHFSVFTEMSAMVLESMRHGLIVDSQTIPDISVGIYWSRHWPSIADAHDARVKFEHNYPGYFPQAASNPQEAWAYPETALAEFRAWMRAFYLPHKFPAYLRTQAAKRQIPAAAVPKLIAVFVAEEEEEP